jgi:hypothetical protein
MSIWTKGNVVIEFVYPKIHIHILQILLGGSFLVMFYNNNCRNGIHAGFSHQQWKIWPQQTIFPRIFLLSFLSIFMHTNNNSRRQKWKNLIIVVCYLQYYNSWETYLSQHKNDENIKSIIYNDIILDECNKKNINLNC